MRDWNRLRERYLSDETPTRLGNIASNMARIRSFCRNMTNRDAAIGIFQENKYFLEWAGTDTNTDIETVTELLELQRQLTRWQTHWAEIWDNPEEKQKVADRSQFWADRILQLSGLL